MNIKDVLSKYQELAPFEDIDLIDPNQTGLGGDAPIHVACRQGELEDLEIMVSAGADINIKGDIGNTPLHEAVSGGNKKIVKRLLELKALPATKNELGQTARDIAVIKGYTEIQEILSLS